MSISFEMKTMPARVMRWWQDWPKQRTCCTVGAMHASSVCTQHTMRPKSRVLSQRHSTAAPAAPPYPALSWTQIWFSNYSEHTSICRVYTLYNMIFPKMTLRFRLGKVFRKIEQIKSSIFNHILNKLVKVLISALNFHYKVVFRTVATAI